MWYAISAIIGVVFGVIIYHYIFRQKQKDVDILKTSIATTLSEVSGQALKTNSEDFLRLANETLGKQTQVGIGELEGKKLLIDKTLTEIRTEIDKVDKSVKDFDIKREGSFKTIDTQLKHTAEQTTKLQQTTEKLQLALANTRERGQWGERMAEDILRLVGFIENINYTKQKTQESTKTRPDYTFNLPKELKVNMDVKFPWDNYQNYVTAQTEIDKESFKNKFKIDVRNKIKQIKTREYICPEEHTVDYAIMFVPNEQVFCFLHEIDSSILEDSLKEKVILCSPITLFAILCVIKQAIDNFALEQTSEQMLSLFGSFTEQWDKYKKVMEKMGARIEEASTEFGNLTTTRTKKLESPLKQIDSIRRQKGIPIASLIDEELEIENHPKNK